MKARKVFDQNLDDVTGSLLIHKESEKTYELIGETEDHKFLLDQKDGNDKLIVSQERIEREYLLLKI